MASIPTQDKHRQGKVLPPEKLPYVCQLLRKLLIVRVARDGIGYDPRRDDVYRSTREIFLNSLEGQAFLKPLVKSAERLLPVTLATPPKSDALEWEYPEYGGNALLVQFQGDLLTRIRKVGIEPVWELSDPAEEPPDTTVTSTENQAPHPNRAQRRAAQKRAKAQELRKQDLQIKEIARELNCSMRQVHTYLKDMQ